MKKTNFHPGNVAARMFLLGATSLFAASLSAQTAPSAASPTAQQPAAAAPHPRHHAKAKPAAATAVPVPPPAPKVLPSLFDQPPQPAAITLSGNQLTIHADNSSLTAILHQVSSTSGMHVDGLAQDQRIFGTYGPGDPHSVISSLLDGSGYNIVMLGQTADGTPRQLTLTPRNAVSAAATPRPAPVANDDDAGSDEDTQPAPPDTPNEPPPQQNPERPNPNSARTPQQMMQELQQMRQQQMQQQQQQQPDSQATPPQPQ